MLPFFNPGSGPPFEHELGFESRAHAQMGDALAVKGAEQILRKEVNAGVHADLLSRLKTEL